MVSWRVFLLDGEGGSYWPEPVEDTSGDRMRPGRILWCAGMMYRVLFVRDPQTLVAALA